MLGLCPAQGLVHSTQTCSRVPPQHPPLGTRSIPAQPQRRGCSPPSTDTFIVAQKCRCSNCGNLRYRVKPCVSSTPAHTQAVLGNHCGHPAPSCGSSTLLPRDRAASSGESLPSTLRFAQVVQAGFAPSRCDITCRSPRFIRFNYYLLPKQTSKQCTRRSEKQSGGERDRGHRARAGWHQAEAMCWQCPVLGPCSRASQTRVIPVCLETRRPTHIWV